MALRHANLITPKAASNGNTDTMPLHSNTPSTWTSRVKRFRHTIGIKGFIAVCVLIFLLTAWRITDRIDKATGSPNSNSETLLAVPIIAEQPTVVEKANDSDPPSPRKSALQSKLSASNNAPSKLPDPINAISTAASPFAAVPNSGTILRRPLRAAIIGFDQRWELFETMTHSNHFTRCNRMMYCERYNYDLYDFTFTQNNKWLEKFLTEYQLPWLKLPLIKEFMRSAIQQQKLDYDVVVWVDSDVSFDQNFSLDDFLINAGAHDFLLDPDKLFYLWNDDVPTQPNFGFVMMRTHNIPLLEQILDMVFKVPTLPPSDTSFAPSSHNISRSVMRKMYPAEEGAFNIAVCLNPEFSKHVMYFTYPFIYGPDGKFFHHVSFNFLHQQWSIFQTEFAVQWRERELLLRKNPSAVQWASKWASKQSRKKPIIEHLSETIGIMPLQRSCAEIFHSHRCYGNCLTESCSRCVCGSISYNQTVGEPMIQIIKKYDLPQSLVTHEELACLITYRSLGNSHAVSEIQLDAGPDAPRKTVLLMGLMQLSPLDCPSVASFNEDLCSLNAQMECIRHILLTGRNDVAKAKAMPISELANPNFAVTTRSLYVEASWPWMFPPSCAASDVLRRDNLYAYLTAEQAVKAAATLVKTT